MKDSSMKDLDEIIAAYLDDRDALSPDEMARLAAELDRAPVVAARLKDQLVVRELVSQKLALDRQNFPAQVAQRRRDFERGEDELFRQVMEVRSLATEELKAQHRQPRRFRRKSFWAGLSLALVLALAAGVFWEQLIPRPVIAQVASLEGSVVVRRNGEELPLAAGDPVRAGDRLIVGQDATARVRYPDRTTVLLDSKAVVEWEGRPQEAKRVVLVSGGLSASVTSQPAAAPMTVETGAAVVRVVGTEFFVYAGPETSRVGVTKGKIALVRRSDSQEAEVPAGNSGFATSDVLQVWQGIWPSNLAGAALVIESEPKMQASDASGAPQAVALVPQGRARLSEHGALVLDDGAFVATGAGQAVTAACRETGEMSVEAIVRPNQGMQSEAAIVFAAGDGPLTPNFALVQSQGRFGFVLRTSDAPGGVLFDLADVAEDSPQRLTVTYRPGRVACYLDGRLMFQRNDLRGDFTPWNPGELIFGDQPTGGHNWRGVLEGVAIYNRVLCKNEVLRNAEAYAEILDSRRPVSASDAPPQE
jgi:ferric-dicitrate binding protein FerR (iron transport regulator)